MPNISDPLQHKNFVRRLKDCEYATEHAPYMLTSWEFTFIRDMREKFDERETMADLGITPWSPTTSQWNTLDEIHRKIA